MAAIVLVHGLWGGGWSWKKIIPLLRAAGHDVHATTGTGVGDRVHLAGPAVDLDTHITDVANVLEFEELTDVTLVGWSYGGMIITGVAERVPERLAGLIYLDALVPVDGQSSYDAELTSEDVRAGDRAAADAAGMPGFLPVAPYAGLARVAGAGPGRPGVAVGEARAAAAGDVHPTDSTGQPRGHGDPSCLHLLHRRKGCCGRPLRDHRLAGPVGS